MCSTTPPWHDPDKHIYTYIHIYKNIKKSSSNALREESSQTNVILQYKLLASILSAVCRIIQQS